MLSESQEPAISQNESEQDTIEALRRGDEPAFLALVSRYHVTLLRIAGMYVHDPAVAEEIVQDTWVGVLKGIGRFEGRSSLKTWLFSILTNLARTRWSRESRSIPLSNLGAVDEETDGPTVDPGRFRPPGDLWPGGWLEPPKPWAAAPEERMLTKEVMQFIWRAIQELPAGQQAVITLRDIEGLTSEEVCNVLKLSETNQRVLLHRARAKVRQALEKYF